MPDLTGCTLRSVTADDMDSVLELINIVQPTLPWSVQHYRWQLQQGPAGPAEIRAIEIDHRIVGLYVATRKQLRIDDRLAEACMVQDVMTHPDFRGRGFLNYMAASFRNEMRVRGLVGFTFPNKLSESSFRRASWTELSRVPLLTTATRADGQAGLLQPVGEFADDVGAIWDESGLRIGVHRDAAFLAWRYRRPETVYHRFVADSSEGFVVLKAYGSPQARVVHICDLVVRQRARDLVPGLLADVHAFARTVGATTITCWLPHGHPYDDQFAAGGFRPDSDNDRFVFVDGPPELLPVLADPASWHLTQGDSDVY